MVAMIETANRGANEYFLTFLPAVNSPPVPHRDISGSSTSTYRPYNEEYAVVQRHVERPVEIEAERAKKEKKWSIGKLFRRKKKEEDSGSSSQSDDVGGLSPSKKKNKKKKRTPLVNNFDHIVIRDTRRAQSLAKPCVGDIKDNGVLSDPSADFLHKKIRNQSTYEPRDYLDFKHDVSGVSTIGLETPAKKKRKSRLKARVEALRNSIRGESSSDEESLKSSNSSSIVRFRSEDSLMRSRDSSLNKKTRTARNERYIKRLSRDEENQLNKEAELLQQGYTKAEVELLTRTPTSQSSGYGTCKREPHNNIKSDQIIVHDSKKGPMKSESISSFPSNQSYLSSINFNAKVNNDHINYSIQCASNNSNRESLYANNQREGSLSNQHENHNNVLCVKFPLGNVPTKMEERSPPVPPPRDMQRKVVTPISMYYENNPTIADRISNNHSVMHGVPNNDFERIMRRSQERTYGTSGLRRPISNSEDHIAMQNNEYMQHYLQSNEQPRRPASVSAEPNHYGIFSNTNTPPWRKRSEQPNLKQEPTHIKQDYLYYADQSPRSRRPITIKNGLPQNQYSSDSQTSFNVTDSAYKRPRNASDFWKKIDDAERLRQQQGIFTNSRSNSDNTPNSIIYRSFSERTKPINKLNQNRAESVDSCNRNRTFDLMDGAKIWKATTEYKQSEAKETGKKDLTPNKTHARNKSETFLTGSNQTISDDEKNSERRKSTNLDDALNELEAIYNSLGLGDEDLLDRAERRELMTPKFNDHYNDWNGNDDNVQLRSQPTTPLRRISRRSTLPDKLQDDMAFRRMNSFSNKEKPNNTEVQSQISYMLASPVYVPYASDDDKNSERNEPDIVHDDVVYRNVKQINNRLKTIDPQPPFGIPVGPISPAPQSDYLHATPENKGRSRFVPKRSPDLVADDLAYRSLRKDNRNSSLFNNEDYSGSVNNNSYTEFPFNKESISNMKKKRAVRSLSANIFTMIQKEIDDAINMTKTPVLQKPNSNNDVMKRLRESFENNDNNSREHYPRNKVKQRHNTVNLFVNNPPPSSHNFTRDDSFIHTDDTCLAKSSCEKSKNSSPLNKSPQNVKRSSKDEFQHVLSMLAQEAMDTSNKLGVALAELDKNRNKNDTLNIQSKISSSRQDFLNGLTEKSCNNNTSDRLEKNSYCNKEESQQSLSNTEIEARGKNTEDSLLVISGQIGKVQEQLKSNVQRNSDIKTNLRESDINQISCITKHPESFSWPPNLDKKSDASNEVKSTSDIDSKSYNESNRSQITSIENLQEDKSEIPVAKINSSNPFISNDEVVKELNEIKAFKELKDGIKDLIAGISEVSDKLFVNKNTAKPKDDQCQNTKNLIEENNDKKEAQNVDCESTNIKRTSFTPSLYENDIKKDEADSTEYNSSEELATIFKFDVQAPNLNENNQNNKQEKREDLSSPKLVKTMSQHLRRLSVDEGTSSQSTPLSTNVVPWRTKQNHNSQNERKGSNQKPKRNWHDSGTLMLACSYTLMFSQHLADLDWLTLLGLLLAIVTMIAILMI